MATTGEAFLPATRSPFVDSSYGSYHHSMRAVGIKQLNNRLSEYVRLAASGETVLVTNRDRVVAEIGPPRKTGNPLADNPRLAEMVRKGELTPATKPWTGPPSSGPPVMTLAEILRGLDEDRADR